MHENHLQMRKKLVAGVLFCAVSTERKSSVNRFFPSSVCFSAYQFCFGANGGSSQVLSAPDGCCLPVTTWRSGSVYDRWAKYVLAGLISVTGPGTNPGGDAKLFQANPGKYAIGLVSWAVNCHQAV